MHNFSEASDHENAYDIAIHDALKTTASLSPVGRLGIWYEGEISWVGDAAWAIDRAFSVNDTSVVSHAYHKQWNVSLTVFDRTAPQKLGCVREVMFKNESTAVMKVKLMMHHLPQRDSSGMTFYAPEEQALVHHYDDICSLFALHMPKATYIQHVAGSMDKHWCGNEGRLSFSPFSSDSAESVVSATLSIAPEEQQVGAGWLLVAKQYDLLKDVHRRLRATGQER
ncbi:hypothetical protein [Shouchella lonarensis]|uniref:Uncharacterized protein n=1 Tax=Shouchella lonarensis TaxID=1464122 RepID=A0A1G6KQ31_9BACI|nr:hypothetical protein [Shouchella lonarensis]SDC33199.1 hypothetical protein SAMN05421737_107114 [Shouchella lonarensis]